MRGPSKAPLVGAPALASWLLSDPDRSLLFAILPPHLRKNQPSLIAITNYRAYRVPPLCWGLPFANLFLWTGVWGTHGNEPRDMEKWKETLTSLSPWESRPC